MNLTKPHSNVTPILNYSIPLVGYTVVCICMTVLSMLIDSFIRFMRYNVSYCILRGQTKGFNHSITTIMCENGSWGEPEQAPHWSVIFVYVRASRCARSVNKKIRQKSHLSFVYVRASLCARSMNKKSDTKAI